MKKILASALLTLTIVGCSIPSLKESAIVSAAQSASFNDIKGHWAEKSINDAIKEGFVDGYPDGTFKPDGNVTRAEFLKMVDTAMKFNVVGGTGNDWYVPYVDAAVKAGVHAYSDFKTGDWNTPITRLEMARIAVRAATGEKNTDDKKWMYLATKSGLITGMDDSGSLGEELSTTRAQSVTIIGRILTVKSGSTLPTDKYAISNGEIAWHKTNMLTLLPRYFSAGQKYRDIKVDELKTTAGDGNFVCEAEKFVVIDMEDPNDPNLKYLPNGVKWVDPVDLKLYEIPKNSYVVLSINKLVVNDNPYGIKRARACTLSLREGTLKDPNTPSKAGVLNQLSSLRIKDSFGYDTGSGLVTIGGRGEYKYTNGHVLPKLNLTNKSVNKITFYRLGEFGQSPVEVYDSATDEKLSGE
ncbi:S-layer homology domain-containing protein [Paenibacillus chitinolyticus]|uniref:S-layer homology domain-containing protein n=1 Tax=Paenibacillus chitinolyticus TaxID=79263 RepID=UPI00295F4C30|nr:S-layer homology domain-containing protein [Paenibacillus chitinolyticus]